MNVLLIDEDDDFRNRFGSYLAENLNGIVLTSVSFLDQTEEGVQKANAADLILTDSEDQLIGELKTAGMTEKIVVFTGEEQKGPFVRSDGIRSVFKFQKASSIISSIAELADAAVSVPAARFGRELEIVGVTGFLGGCGRTSFSLMYARMLWRSQKKTSLILSVEKMGNINDYFQQSRVKSDFNLMLLNFASGFRVAPQRFIAEDDYGVSAFVMPEQTLCDIGDLSTEEVTKLMDMIANWGYFDTLILDVHPQMEPISGIFLRAADRVFVMHDQRQGIRHSEQMWLERLVSYCIGDLHHIMNMSAGDRTNGDLFIEEKNEMEDRFDPLCYIPYDSASFFIRDGIVDISMSGNFARCIADIVERI